MIQGKIIPFVLLLVASALHSAETARIYLSGTGSDDTVDWEFWVNGGRQAGVWTTIPVPSNWEMMGFGTYHYENDWEKEAAPDSEARYRHAFTVPEDWQGRRIDLVFGGVMTDTTVWLNGKQAGPIHQGGFYEFRHDVSGLVRFGEVNQLEVLVRKYSSNESVNRSERAADYWLFGGIFRPVWLEARPASCIERFAVDARHDGSLKIEASLQGITEAGRLKARLLELDGSPVGPAFAVDLAPGQETALLEAKFPGIRTWTAETPDLYRVRVSLERNGELLHQVSERIGFRTVEVRPHDGIYVNGEPISIRGVNRHTFWPTTGRTTNAGLSRQDVELIKGMNMNAVRMSHYPPDPHFLDVCDELGLYVIDELAGWQDAYDTTVGRKLVRETVLRDRNHPSIIFWANGNEGGYNMDLVDEYARYDLQQRQVILPWLNFNGVDTTHYLAYDCCLTSGLGGNDIYMPTEFLHALYDGGGGAGLQDWWDRMRTHPLAVGGFIWAFADEGIVRDDLGGKIDVYGNRAPDGLVGPFREKEGSYFAVREIWSPVHLPMGRVDRLGPEFDGRMPVHNDYDFTNLDQVQFRAELVTVPGPGEKAADPAARPVSVMADDVQPGGSGFLQIDLPADWRRHDLLRLTASGPGDNEIYTWTWMITPARDFAVRQLQSIPAGPATSRTDGKGKITLRSGPASATFDSASGQLLSLSRGQEVLPLSNGPRVIGGTSMVESVDCFRSGETEVLECRFSAESSLRSLRWTLHPGGWLQLDYTYRLPRFATRDNIGVSFDLPETRIESMEWLGRGPYRVWKNRMAGVEFGQWKKTANNGGTGWAWNYPEFPGFHANLYWASLQTESLPLNILSATDDIFLRLLTPEDGPDPRHTAVGFPEGDLSFMQGIPAIGTKFHAAASHGPQGSLNAVGKHHQWPVTLFFYFGELSNR